MDHALEAPMNRPLKRNADGSPYKEALVRYDQRGSFAFQWYKLLHLAPAIYRPGSLILCLSLGSYRPFQHAVVRFGKPQYTAGRWFAPLLWERPHPYKLDSKKFHQKSNALELYQLLRALFYLQFLCSLAVPRAFS